MQRSVRARPLAWTLRAGTAPETYWIPEVTIGRLGIVARPRSGEWLRDEVNRREGRRALAARFLDEFERIAKLLVEHPGIGTPTEDQRRWFPLACFPYSVIYRETETGIRILVPRHLNRDPEHGQQRR